MEPPKPKSDLPFWLRPLSRRELLRLGGAGVAGGSLGAGYVFRWEPENLEITRRRITLAPHATGDKVIRAVQLSDLHASHCVPMPYLRRAVAEAIALKPDIFFLTGDYVTSKFFQGYAELSEILRPLTETAPTYAILGNHDGGSWAGLTYGHPDSLDVQKMLADAAITLLFNQARQIEVKGHRLFLVGLADSWNDDYLPLAAFNEVPADIKAKPPGERPPIILLSHNPDSKSDVGGYPWDLMLCGHTHGGQLVVPFLDLRPFLPIYDKRFSEGLHEWEGRQIYITRGVGNLHGARINCRPEISQLDLVVG
jgi:predicted MPP superfamily phosphohydrolase